MGSSEAVTTDSIMWLVGVRGDVVTSQNLEELTRRLVHPFVKRLGDGDVLWPVRDTVKKRIHLCAVRMGRTPDEAATGIISRELGDDHEGSVAIVGGSIVLTAGKKTFDMLTCRPWKPVN